jgi:hypothetical protein
MGNSEIEVTLASQSSALQVIDENLKIFGLNVSMLGRVSVRIDVGSREACAMPGLTARMFHIEEHGRSDGTRTRGLLGDRAAVGSTASGLATVLLKFHIMISNLISAGKR